ncbi:hypothetical protein niasHS_017669 [Heterodera schachtii]|uniref:SOSS complex subunit A homolog n=1 Tax=Heterodera schachtii TaxID=97005 RepID=A0ABD2I4B0_HETSC
MMLENESRLVNSPLTKLQTNNSNNNNGQQLHQTKTTFPSILLLPGRNNEQIINMESHYHSQIERLSSLTEVEMAELIASNTNLNNVQALEILDGLFCAFLIESQNSSKYLNCLPSSDMCWNHMLYNANYVLIEEFSFLKSEYRHRMVQFLAYTIKMNVPSVDSCLSNLFRALSDGTEFVETCKLVFSVSQILSTNQKWLIGLKKNSLALADAFAFMARFVTDVPLVVANVSSVSIDLFKSALVSTCELLIRERFVDLATTMGRDLMISLMRLSKLTQFQNVWKALLHNPISLMSNFSLKQLMLSVPTDKFLGSRVSVNISRKIDQLLNVVKMLLGQNKISELTKHFEAFKNTHLSEPDSGTMRAEIIRHIWAHLKQEEQSADCCEARAWLIGWLLRSSKVGAEMQWCKLMLFWDWFGFDVRVGPLFIEPAFTTVRTMLNKFPKYGNTLVDFLIRETQILYPQLNSFFVQSITNVFRVLEKANFPIHIVLGHLNLETTLKEQFRSMVSDLFPKKMTVIANNLAEPSTIIDFDAIRSTSTPSFADGTTAHSNGKDSLAEGQGHAKKLKLTQNLIISKEKALPLKQAIPNTTRTSKKHFNECKTDKEQSQPILKRKKPKSKEEPNGVTVKAEESTELCLQSVAHPHHSPEVPSTSGSMCYDSRTTIHISAWEGNQMERMDGENDEKDNVNRIENLLPMVREEFREHLEELDEAIRQQNYPKAGEEVQALADSLFDADEFDNEQAECISLCLLHIFLENAMRKGSRARELYENDPVDNPIFILFRVIAQSEDGSEVRKSLLNILAKMRKECACVGYLFLSFMRKVENEMEMRRENGDLEVKGVADTYRSLCGATESDLEGALVSDLEKCSFDNVSLFAHILPCVLSTFFSYGSPHKLLRVICASIDPRQLSRLMSEIVRENIVLFSPDEILVLLHDSLKWESMEQFMLWQLIQVEAVELDKFLDLLQRLNYAQHPEATAAILVIIRNMEPDPDPAVMRSLLRNLFLRQPDRDLFTVDALKLIVDYSDNIPPMSDCISKMVKHAIHNDEIFAPVGHTKLGKARPRVPMVENILDHLDRFRRHCIDRESKGVENLLNNALTLELFRSLKSHPKLADIRSRFTELFALFDILLDAKKQPKADGRHRRRGKGKSGPSASSRGAPDLDPSDGSSSWVWNWSNCFCVCYTKKPWSEGSSVSDVAVVWMFDAVVCGFLANNSPFMPPFAHPFNNWCRQTVQITDRKRDRGNGINHFGEVGGKECLLGGKVRGAKGRRREWARRRALLDGTIALAVCILMLCLFCLAVLLLIPWPMVDRSFADVSSDESNFRFVEVARMCGDGGNCRTVVDIISRRSNSARRAMFFDGLSDSFESEVPLIRPQNATVDDSDTRLWHVDHGTLLNEYVAAMAVLPFSVASLGLSPTDGQRLGDVAIVGLGGGSLDAFLHLKIPSLNITVYESDSVVVELAKQWFEVSDDQTRRTVVGDGAAAISDHVKRGNRFDAIILDACDSSPHIPCPASPFIALKMLGNAKSALRPRGVFVMNALPASEQNEQKTLALLQDKLLSVFPLCVRMTMGRQMNSVFACLPYAISPKDLENTVLLWQQRKDEVASRLQLHSLLRGSQLTIGGLNSSVATHF